MKIKSNNVKNSILHPDFGGYGNKMDKNQAPSHSLHLEWEEVSGAKSYALEMIDYEASGVVGFPFIHWVVANIKTNSLEEGASLKNQSILQGVNSRTPKGIVPEAFRAPTIELASQYFGPYPPDQSHDYVIRIYALNVEKLNLAKNFNLADLHRAIKGHVIDKGKFVFTYLKK
ncbi:YbhB/YbcL family Raf kinase inhibitor-like protein [[Mycoplasma] mobile]|uniref:Putative phospholipid binding protein n=1 Tax=Mycoplasma mobile (strain ATCC 43663 / 163K / NCTC 11711) TaxID=267748 RepID=Q6KIK7_MYCM1|nr:YbhB/YbcL family Raf kinase inhibitor-like protein [[Mycoplasma] mobile]AAT27569.1 putative phospholipid binding protein [Mycoplasma mobile 163K]